MIGFIRCFLGIGLALVIGAVAAPPMLAEDSLARAVANYLNPAESVEQGDLFALSGKVFAEYIRADDDARIIAIRELLGAYARAGKLEETIVPYSLLHRLPISGSGLLLASADHLFDWDIEVRTRWSRILNDRMGTASSSGYVDLREVQSAGQRFWESAQRGSVVRFLFQKSPSSALLALASVYAPGKGELDLLLKDRRITDFLLKAKLDGRQTKANEEIAGLLKDMSTSEHAWVRLYVAEMILQNRILRDDSIVESLGRDKDELVLRALSDLHHPSDAIRHRPVRAPWSAL